MDAHDIIWQFASILFVAVGMYLILSCFIDDDCDQ